MFGKVLLPTDFSEYSWKTMECGLELATVGAKEIVLLHVVEIPAEILTRVGLIDSESIEAMEKRITESMMDELRQRAKLFEEKGFVAGEIVIVSEGKTSDAILETAEKENVDLILIGSRGMGWFSRKLLGSVSDEVLIRSRKPVLLAKFKIIEKEGEYYFKMPHSRLFERIVYACDLSTICMDVVEQVRLMASQTKGEVILLYVEEFGEDPGVKERIKTLEKAFEGINFRSLIVQGTPRKEILRVSKDENASLLVLSSSGRGGSLFGGTVDAVARRAEIPVLVLKS